VRGCHKVSPGCKHCYAETFSERWRGVPGHPYEQGFDVRLVPEKLAEPLRWQKPKKVFVNSMSDLFQDEVPHEFVVKVFETMRSAYWHTFQILTKRADLMEQSIRRMPSALVNLRNVWLGVSVENQKHGLPRIEYLRRTPATVRFLSIEPLLEDLGMLCLDAIDWVIVGGESGPGARGMKREWVLRIRDECRRRGIPFFFKQWGGTVKSRTGRELDGDVYDDFPRHLTALPPPKHLRVIG
jgi:protein gp37